MESRARTFPTEFISAKPYQVSLDLLMISFQILYRVQGFRWLLHLSRDVEDGLPIK